MRKTTLIKDQHNYLRGGTWHQEEQPFSRPYKWDVRRQPFLRAQAEECHLRRKWLFCPWREPSSVPSGNEKEVSSTWSGEKPSSMFMLSGGTQSLSELVATPRLLGQNAGVIEQDLMAEVNAVFCQD